MNTTKNNFMLLMMMCCILFSTTISAQAFHFLNTTTSIIKTTAQSPAHWYIQIYNDAGVDTTLRWKADISGVPSAWNITFDDQNIFHQNLKTGDSSDFVLFDSLAFPQKLIIGAWTNNTPGTGSVFFDVYDPANPAGKVTIEYIFIITQAVGIMATEPDAQALKITDNKIYFALNELTSFNIISQSGQLIHSGKIKNGMYDFSELPPGVYFVYFMEGDKFYGKKFAR